MNKCDMEEVKHLAVLKFIGLIDAGAKYSYRVYGGDYLVTVGGFCFAFDRIFGGYLSLNSNYVVHTAYHEQLKKMAITLADAVDKKKAELREKEQQRECQAMLKAVKKQSSWWQQFKAAWNFRFNGE